MRQADFPQRGITAAAQPGQWHNYTIMWWDVDYLFKLNSF